MSPGASNRPSIGDVARLAGVSVGTVSNVLNRPEIVAESKCRVVREAIKTLGFVPNASARNLREGSSRTAGVLVLDIGNPFFMEMARGIEDRLYADNLTMVLSSSNGQPARERRVLEQFAGQRLRGVLLTPSRGTYDNLAVLAGLGMRVVLLDHKPRHPDIDAVSTDDVSGARQAVEHLVGLGHDRIGFINGPLWLQQCRARRTGARRAVRGAGGATELFEIDAGALDAASGEEAMGRLVRQHPEVTAVFCVNDLVALGAMRYAREHAIAVPDRVSVIGYDDVPFAAELAVPLSSVRQPTYRLGWEAADRLLAPGEPRQVVFQPELVARTSTGPRRTVGP